MLVSCAWSYSTGAHPRVGGCPKNCTWHSCRGTDPLRSFLVAWCGQSIAGHHGCPSMRLQTIWPAEKRSWVSVAEPLARTFFKGFRGTVFFTLGADPFFLLRWSPFDFFPADTGGEVFLKNVRSVPWDIMRQRPAKKITWLAWGTHEAIIGKTKHPVPSLHRECYRTLWLYDHNNNTKCR